MGKTVDGPTKTVKNICFWLSYKNITKTVPKTVKSKAAMHLQMRMQDAGCSGDVERWQSDSDSDASADEANEDEAAGTLSQAQLLRLMA